MGLAIPTDLSRDPDAAPGVPKAWWVSLDAPRARS
jgi:hypothetical protein